MTFKTFYENVTFRTEQERTLENTVYTKTFIRKELKNQNKLAQIDAFGKLKNFKVIGYKEGALILPKKLGNKNENIHSALNEKIDNLSLKQKQLIFLNKTKGGSRIFHSGFSGFSPYSQVSLFSTKILKSLVLDKNQKRKITNYNFLISKTNKKEKLFHVFRAPFKKETLKLSAQFFKLKAKRNFKFQKPNRSQLNIVCIFGKPNKKNKNIKKLKKDTQ